MPSEAAPVWTYIAVTTAIGTLFFAAVVRGMTRARSRISTFTHMISVPRQHVGLCNGTSDTQVGWWISGVSDESIPTARGLAENDAAARDRRLRLLRAIQDGPADSTASPRP